MGINLFWAKRLNNFGDVISPIIVEWATGIEPTWAKDGPKLLGIGSILSLARSGDTLWGTGLWGDEKPASVPRDIKVLAVRGPYTRMFLRRHGVEVPSLMADPAEFLPHIYMPMSQPTHKVGYVPHYSDKLNFDGLVIDVSQPWKTVIDQITSCELIVASSLHGIITAEAYGIPAIWICCNRDQLKYRDYYGASGRNPQPTTWAKALKMTSSPIPLPQRRDRVLLRMLEVLRREYVEP